MDDEMDLERTAGDVVRALGGPVPPVARVRRRVQRRRRQRGGLAGAACLVAMVGLGAAVTRGPADEDEVRVTATTPSTTTTTEKTAPTTDGASPAQTPATEVPPTMPTETTTAPLVEPVCTDPLPPEEVDGITATLTIDPTSYPGGRRGWVVIHNSTATPFEVRRSDHSRWGHVVSPPGTHATTHYVGQMPAVFDATPAPVPANGSSDALSTPIALTPCESDDPYVTIGPGTYDVRAIVTLQDGRLLSTNVAEMTIGN